MKRSAVGWIVVSLVAGCTIAAHTTLAPAADRSIDFNRDIKPILSNNCFQCHGPDEAERKGGTDGLRLDTQAGAIEDLGGYAAIVPGDLEQSALIARVASADPDEVMPPAETGKRLSAEEIELLRAWVRQGGKYSQHWSYVKPVRPELPAVKNTSWPRNEIDHFILARLESEGLSPSPEADRAALVRRLSLDLTGLPPTLDEVDAFLNDQDPQAYEKLVDQLLAKNSYGEHWAHMWLDLARYADSAGYADDPPRTIWLFRDYVIRSLNANQPFDQFTIEQLAGDLLPNPRQDQLIATAFHRNTLTNNEGGTNDEEFRNVAVVDRVNTTMAVWMGTTAACAQCHTHKYDPISQEEYFRLFAFFNQSEDADRFDESPLAMIYSDEQQKLREQWQTELAALEAQLRTPTPELQSAQAAWEQSLPRDLQWHAPRPLSVATREAAQTTILDDAVIAVAAKAANDDYSVELPLEQGKLHALRLEALPDASLPGSGPGHSHGNFVITRVAAAVVPSQPASPVARYVRIELPGAGRILSLAEVQVFQGSENIAPRGQASQSSTAYEGAPSLAIDGNTNGNYFEAKSVTHTDTSNDPWWELDLQSNQPIDRLTIWNRTDNGTGDRLNNFRILVLNEQRQPLWEQTVAAPPNPSSELTLSGSQAVPFDAAFADFTQANFDPQHVLNNPDPKQKGWAIGGQIGQPHVLTLTSSTGVDVPPGAKLVVTIEHASQHPNHVLGRFRLSLSGDPAVVAWVRLPAAVTAALRVAPEQRSAEQQAAITNYYLSIAEPLQPARERIAALNKQLAEMKPLTVPIMKELPPGQHRVTKIQHRGNFLDLGAEVTAGTPAVFPPLPADVPPNRLALARWLVDDDNPLTARVIANRYWEQIFGIGIVASSEEFGSQGELPSHPELLDWLATELVRLQWDRKAFLKQLVTSATYRQSSRVTNELIERDPDNRLLARGPRFRLSAETVRDQALSISGLLSPKMYGPPVKPPQPSIGLTAAFGSGIDWQTSDGEDRYRRGLYTTWRRSNPYPSMAAFDAPNREVCTVRRVRTNTPLQALVTLNDPVYIEAAQALARRIIAEGGSSPHDRGRYAFRLCLSRVPEDAELSRLVQLYEQSLARFAASPDQARAMATEPLGPAPADMQITELAAWTVVGNVLLNLDETLMKR